MHYTGGVFFIKKTITVGRIFENYPKQNSNLRNSRMEFLSIEVHAILSTQYIEVNLPVPNQFKLF